MEQIYELLKKAEDIKLAPELLEPEPPKSANDMTYVFAVNSIVLIMDNNILAFRLFFSISKHQS
jgi:hypothetical protein